MTKEDHYRNNAAQTIEMASRAENKADAIIRSSMRKPGPSEERLSSAAVVAIPIS
jgi:hypothetical protein